MSLTLDLNEDEQRAIETAWREWSFTDFELIRMLQVRRHLSDARYSEDWGAIPCLAFIKWMAKHDRLNEHG